MQQLNVAPEKVFSALVSLHIFLPGHVHLTLQFGKNRSIFIE